jgi:hypothetical protein
MEDKKCAMSLDGKECGLPLTLVDLEAEKIARYDLATYECNLRHRTYFLFEPK